MVVKIKKVKNKINKSVNKSIKNSKKRIKNIMNETVLFFKEKGKMTKIKKMLLNLYKFLINKNVLQILLCSIPFIIMDVSTRLFTSEIDFYPLFSFTPRIFSLAYIILILGISFNINKKNGLYTYIGSFIIFFTLFLIQNVYYDTTNNFFSFSILGLASEGSSYFFDSLINCNPLVYIVSIITIIIFIFAIKLTSWETKLNNKNLGIIFIIFISLHLIGKSSLGQENFELTWNTWRMPRNVYNNFNDSNKCMALAGLYEYTVRDFYITYIKPETKKSETESNFLEEVFSSENDSKSKNKYTGLLEGKNVIFLQLEGIDNWLLTEEIMPNTYSLLKNSINFANHYSFYNGGGSTFNSEFAVNVGYMTPFTYPVNAYTLNKNDFPYSMANLMKSRDYSLKVFHMNSKEYYSRGINYSNFGYDQYFGLKDLKDYSDYSHYLDRELILNETFYNEMFKGEGKFVNYIITYSTHMPFGTNRGVCKLLIEKDYANTIEGMSKSEKEAFISSLNMSEEDCIKRQAKETDYMVKLLIQALKDNNLYDNTVIVAYADHYLYTVTDENILAQYKDTETNLINKTPFFIWSSDIKPETVTKVTNQLCILPTFLNLMGIDYNEKWYVSSDALDKSYQSLAIFSDLSWYDGNIYVVDGIVKNNKKINEITLEQKNNLVEYLIKKNDLVLKYNYFKEVTD